MELVLDLLELQTGLLLSCLRHHLNLLALLSKTKLTSCKTCFFLVRGRVSMPNMHMQD